MLTKIAIANRTIWTAKISIMNRAEKEIVNQTIIKAEILPLIGIPLPSLKFRM